MVSSVFGARGGERVKLADLGATHGWRSGQHEAYPFVASGEIRLQEGEHDLYWENLSGGQIDFDCVVLCSDPDWDPAERIRLTIWHPRAYEVRSAEARHRLPGDPGGGVLERQPRRGHRRRGADRGAPRRAWRPPGAGDDGPEDVPAWEDWTDAEIHIFSAWGWNNLIQPVERFDAESRTIEFESYNDVRPGNRYFISGTRGCSDRPG